MFKNIAGFFSGVKYLGSWEGMDDYERRRLGIFNLINFFGFLTGLCMPVAGLLNEGYLPPLAWIIAVAPAVISGLVLLFNYFQEHRKSRIIYFTCYPIITSVVYLGDIDVGINLFLLLYAVLAVFFLQRISNVAFAVIFSVSCYVSVTLIYRNYTFRLEDINYPFYVANQVLAILFIFAGIILIKKESNGYQAEILERNRLLEEKNYEIECQKILLAEKATQLEEQTRQLSELNAVKNRLFSIIGHDLRTPIYGLRNLFKNVQQYDLPGDEIKLLVPEISQDLQHITGLMENLLQWAKSQMQGNQVNPTDFDLYAVIKEVYQQTQIQAQQKYVGIKIPREDEIMVHADRDMISLVLRNLVSNAIKFTDKAGQVTIDIEEQPGSLLVLVRDTGMGISPENLEKILEQQYFSTKGTSNEHGTGLGLMLCSDFVEKNKGRFHIESKVGVGTVCSFSIPYSPEIDHEELLQQSGELDA